VGVKIDRRVPKSIDEYIAGFPAEVRAALESIRATIRSAAPRAREGMKYGMPTFVLNGNLAHFAAWKSISAFIIRTRRMRPWGISSQPTRGRRDR
jgi:hypothetical protein